MAKEWTVAKEPTEKELTMEERMLRFQERQLEIQERQLALQEGNAHVQKEQLKQTARKSNQFGPHVSIFNPQGEKDYPMPALKCEVEIGFPQTPQAHGFDYEEVELINLLEPCETTIELNDGTIIPACIVGQKDQITKRWEKIALRGPKDPDTGKYTPLFTHSNKQQFPMLKVLLRHILGERAEGVLTMAQRRRKCRDWELAEDKDAAVAAGALPVSVGA
jgi:hypothetical protein